MDFYKRVGIVCNAIPEGRAASYGQIALLCGKPRNARQVGYCLNRGRAGKVPAHRVVNSQGYLTGGRILRAPGHAAHAFGGGGTVERCVHGAVWLEKYAGGSPCAQGAVRAGRDLSRQIQKIHSRSSFRSPSLIQPILRSRFPRMGVRTAGIRKQTRRMPSHIFAPPPMAVNTADGAHQAAGAHAGASGDIFQAEHHGGQGSGDHGDQCGRNPDPGIVHDVSHLEHAGAEPLGKEARPSYFPASS